MPIDKPPSSLRGLRTFFPIAKLRDDLWVICIAQPSQHSLDIGERLHFTCAFLFAGIATSEIGGTGRWHDDRHTLITELAESGASDETIMAIAGHISKKMLRHYSHIRTEAKRRALDEVLKRRQDSRNLKAAEQELAEAQRLEDQFAIHGPEKPTTIN